MQRDERKKSTSSVFSGMLVMLALAASTDLVSAEEVRGIRPWQDNPWYWSYRGEPLLLLGGSDDDNPFQWPETALIEQLDRIRAAGGNVIRNTMSDRQDRGFEVYPFAEVQGEGGRKRESEAKKTYDLDRWNPEYWDRFERFLRETHERGIIVQIEVWDRFDYSDNGKDHWLRHPYNPANNENYTFAQAGFAPRYPGHPGMNVQPFFFTTPAQKNNEVVLAYQRRFVDRMLQSTLAYDHILYCIDNETSGEEAWGRYWADFIHTAAQQRGRKVWITEMWDDWDLTAERHRRTFDHPDLYGFVDVSQNNHNKGQRHWDLFLTVREKLAGQPRPMNTTKTYGATGNKFRHTDQDGIERFWRHLLAGAASLRFHRPDSGLGINERAVRSIRSARLVEKRIPLWKVNAANELIGEREENEAYLAASIEAGLVLYFPAQGNVQIDLRRWSGSLQVTWISIDEGKELPNTTLKAGQWQPITPPGEGNWVATLVPLGH